MNINKPLGWTSHDVVARVRRLAGNRRVGHAGTLDPLASGVLPVLLGRATRLADFIQTGRKTYLARVKLGEATETDDAEGEVISTWTVPALTDILLEDVLNRFTGEILQRPPKYSALKIGGQKAYALARRGDAVDLAERPITIDALRLLNYVPTSLELEVVCSKGTYMRALARDIAAALGTVGHLSSLTRTRVGPFTLENAVSIDDLTPPDLTTSLLPPSCAIPDALVYRANAEETLRLRNGQAIDVANIPPSPSVWVYDPEGNLLCLASAEDALLRPHIAL